MQSSSTEKIVRNVSKGIKPEKSKGFKIERKQARAGKNFGKYSA